MAAIAPATIAFRTMTSVGVPAIRWTNGAVPGGTAIVMPMPGASSWTPMTKYGASSGAISGYAARIRFMPATAIASW